jgi:hypothetical protein
VLRILIAVVLLALPCGVVLGETKEGLPKDAKTTADILKVVESNKGYYKFVSTCPCGKRAKLELPVPAGASD